MEIPYVPVMQLQPLIEKIEKIDDHIQKQDERKNVLNSRWVSFRKICEEFEIDPKSMRKYQRIYSWPTTKLGGKVYYDIEAILATLDSNAKK